MRTIAITALWALTVAAPAADVTYFDPKTKKEEVLTDVNITEETTAGLTITLRNKESLKVSALDVRWVRYVDADVKPLDSLAYNRPFGSLIRGTKATTDKERVTELQASIKAFNELLPKLTPKSKAQRHAQYSRAQALHRLAQAEPAVGGEALAALKKFRADHADGWQTAPALIMLAQLQEDAGDQAAVQKTYEELANVPGVSDEIKQTSLIASARSLLKSEKYDEAAAQFERVRASLTPESPNLEKVQIYLAQCHVLGKDATKAAAAEKQLRALIGQSSEAAVKAQAHNTLGDYYQKNDRPEDAFWEYLRVDVLYSEDRQEHARALYHLAKLFRQHKQDALRADDCLKLLEDKKYLGTEFQKKVGMK